MKITKYQHACFTVEADGQLLVVDPGEWSTDFTPTENIVAIVITHEHFDHCNEGLISEIFDKNPNIMIISHQNVLNKINLTINMSPVTAGDSLQIAPFNLAFFGGQHATIRPDMPPVDNLGVMINSQIYYPGDSLSLPDLPIDTLALPISAPWLKFSEAAEFLDAAKPRLVFPTHDAILSDNGKQLLDSMMSSVAEQIGSTYQRIDDESLSL